MSLFFISCSKSKKEENSDENKFQMKSAVNIVENYMGYLSNEDYKNAKKLYTKELEEKSKDMGENKLKIKGYNMENISEVGRSALIEMKVTRSSETSSEAFLDNYAIKVIKEKSEYKISEIKYNPEKEGFNEKKQIRQRSKKNVKTDLVTEMGSLPNYFFPKDDGGNIYKVPVTKDEFGPIQFSYSGDKIAVSTKGENPYIGVIAIDDTLAVQGSGAGGGGGGDKSEGQQGDQEGKSTGMKEKPVGKEIVSLDILKGSSIEFLVFSQDEELLLCQYKSSGGKIFRIYKAGSGEMVPIDFKSIFPVDKVDLVYDSFNKDILNFEVKKRDGINSSDTSILGKYKLDLKEFNITKL
ncbi:hypothetical protein [Hathewaya massiliensis]|uniref:hypothetical protein n=1 Tax=Hathewaya massiliensis TaxID=1964382 RepID=UPI0011576F12|nr:hypothetical protein [Hathewaya massiliensis]